MKAIKALITCFILLCSVVVANAQGWAWAKAITGLDSLEVRDFKMDANGDLVILGYHVNQITFDSQSKAPFGKKDMYLIKVDQNGNLKWIQNAGSNDVEDPFAIGFDTDNNIYVGGGFRNMMVFSADVSITSSGAQDAFLAKYNSSGRVLWAKKIAYGTLGERIHSMAISSNNEIYMCGMLKSSPTTIGSFLLNVSAGGEDEWIAKADTSGNISWVKQLTAIGIPGSNLINLNILRNISVDQDGLLYVSGTLWGQLTYGSQSFNSKGYGDIVLFHVNNADGSLIWGRTGGGTEDDKANGLTLGPDNGIYLTGQVTNNVSFDSTSTKTSSVSTGSSLDIILLKYNQEGRLIWKTRTGGVSSDGGFGIASRENLLMISGYYSSSLTFNDVSLNSGSTTNNDAGFFVYDLDGNPITAQGVVGTLEDVGQGIAIDQSGDTYIAGYFKSPILTFGSTSINNLISPKRQGFVAKYANPFSATFTHVQSILCNGAATGELTVTPYFGTYPYTYAWTLNGSPISLADSVATGLAPGTYAVTVTDFNGKVASTSTTITEPTALAISGTATAALNCYGDADGAISITPSGGVAPYRYYWNTTDGNVVTEMTKDQAGLIAGTYTVTLTDTNGCTLDRSFTIAQPQKIVFSGSKVVHIDNVTTGSVTLNVTGGTPAYTDYNWSSGQTTQNITGLNVGGDYKVTVTDSHTCQADTTFWVDDQRVFYATLQTKTDVLCKGGSSGTATIAWANSTTGNVTVTVTGQAPQVYSSATSGTHYATGLAAGNYVATVYDGIKTKTVNFTIDEPLSALSATAVAANTNCYGGSDGIVNLTVAGGTAPYDYLWSPGGSTSQDLSNQPAGTYSVIVTDANGCTSNAAATISEPNDITYSIDITTPISCYGSREGVLTINNAQGGTGSYSYLWSNTLTTQSISNLAKGTYWAKVTDDNGCYKKVYQTLTQPTQVSASFAVTDPACNAGSNGSITITPSGGTPGYDYSVNGGAYDVNANISGLTAGNYNIVVRDNNLCTRSYSATLNEPAAIVITPLTTNPTCPESTNGSIGITATGGTAPYGYFWTTTDGSGIVQGAQNQSALSPGTYTLLLTDAHGCSKTIDVTLTAQNPSPTPGISTLDNPVCQGSNATITATGGSSYEFFLNGSLVQGPSASSSLSRSTFSNGDVVYANVISSAGCVAQSSNINMVVNGLPTPTLTSSDLDNSICDATPVTFTAGGGNTYEFLVNDISQGAPSTTNQYITSSLADGDAVKVIVTDMNSCSATSAPIVTAVTPNVGVPTFTSGAANLCVGSTSTYQATASNSAGIVYSIISGGASINSATGVVSAVTSDFTVRATATGINGCGVETADMAVAVHALPTVSLGPDQTICAGTTATLDAGTFASYLWSDNSTSQTLTTGTAGSYSVTVTDVNGCSATSAPVTITVNSLPIVDLGGDRAICVGSTTTLDAGTFASYLWSDNSTSQTFTTGTAGSYSVTVTDANGCSATSSPVVVTVNPLPTVDLGGDRAICTGSTATLDAGPFASYLWSDNSTNRTLVTGTAGSYSVTVTDVNGCSATSSPVAITINPLPTVDLGGDRAICVGSTVTLDAGSFASYSWSNNSTGQTLVTGTAGSYSVTVTDANGCSATSSPVVVTVNPLPTVDLGGDQTICDGSMVTLDAGPFASYLWSDNSTNQTLTTGMAGSYNVTVTDVNGCSATSAPIAITVNPSPLLNLAPTLNMLNTETKTIDAGSGFATYLWESGGSNLGSEQTYLVDGSVWGVGSYTINVTVTNSDGCSTSGSVAVSITLDNAVPENSNDRFTVFPNPATSTVFLSLGQNLAGAANVRIVSVTGALVRTGTVNFASGEDKVPFSVEQLKPGSYFLIVDIGSNRFTKKIIIR